MKHIVAVKNDIKATSDILRPINLCTRIAVIFRSASGPTSAGKRLDFFYSSGFYFQSLTQNPIVKIKSKGTSLVKWCLSMLTYLD